MSPGLEALDIIANAGAGTLTAALLMDKRPHATRNRYLTASAVTVLAVLCLVLIAHHEYARALFGAFLIAALGAAYRAAARRADTGSAPGAARARIARQWARTRRPRPYQ